MTLVIDAHNHLGGPDKGDGMSQSAGDIIAKMDAAGIDKAVVFPFNDEDPGISFSRSNDQVYSDVSQNPGRLIGFGRLDPNQGEQAVAEARRCVIELGLSGIKLHPHAQKFAIDSATVYRIAGWVADVRPDIPIIFDNGKPASPNQLIGDLADTFPDVTFILAHMRGGDFIEVTAAHDNIFIQTTGVPKVEVVQQCVDELGADRVMMGSDSPYHSMEDEVMKVEALQLSEAEKLMVFSGTAKNVLKI
ncbi:MAG: amidohydrolase family protein [Methanosarcinales archaeon]|nr:amidohydrolase family protein [Methanosarcinales archaeon]